MSNNQTSPPPTPPHHLYSYNLTITETDNVWLELPTIIPFPHSQHNPKVCPKKAASPCIPTYVKNRRFTVEKFDNRWPRIAVECAIVQKKFRGVKIDDLKTTVNLFKHRDRGSDLNFRFFEKRRPITPSHRR